MMSRSPVAVVFIAGLATAVSARPGAPLLPVVHAQSRADAAPVEPVDGDMVWRIRREITERSQIMPTIQMLTDLYGPRLTGSPNLRRAQDWIVQQTTAWGLKNAHLEAWDFGHPGWLNERTSVHRSRR